MPRLHEFRKGKRYWFRAPVRYSWRAHNGEPRTGEGVTRDVNTSGAYIVADELPSLGALVQLEIALPKVPRSSSGMSLHGEGVVVRTESAGCQSSDTGIGEGGFAAAMQFYPERTDAVVSQLKRPVLVM